MEEDLNGELSTKRRQLGILPRACAYIFIGLMVATAIALRVSTMTPTVRLLVVVMLGFGLFTGLVYLIRYFLNEPRALCPAFFILALFVTWSILGKKPPNVRALEQMYVKQLLYYRGTPHQWAGETNGGIDCSGLARAALWQAMLKVGVKEANSSLLGPQLWKFWWRDLSAGDMLKGRYGYTRVIGVADRLAGHDTSALSEGDMAIVGRGTHVLIYCGEDQWIGANPQDGRVVLNKATARSKRPYFLQPVTFVRWWILQ